MPCRTLTEIFEAAGLSRVHFFSLDVEDFVHQALASLDLDRVDVDVLLVEVRADADVDVAPVDWMPPTAWFKMMFKVGGADFADCKRMTRSMDWTLSGSC